MTESASASAGLGFPRRHGIVVALDVPTVDEAERIVDQTTAIDGVVGYKIGPIAALEYGLTEVVRRLRASTDRVLIYDHQKAGLDIGSNARNFADVLGRAGVDAAILFPLAGPSAAASFIDELAGRGVRVLVGGELPLPDYRESGGGWIVDDALAHIVKIAVSRGRGDLIVPVGDGLAEIVGGFSEQERADLRLYVPGIGSGGAGLETLAGIAASVAGVYPIVGRAVIAADDPAAAAGELVRILEATIDGATR